jgi:iron complex outermembrane receptor protein
MRIVTVIDALRRRAVCFCATFLALITVVQAQVTTTPPEDGKKSSDVLNLSVYRVTTTQDSGYNATSATPFKTKQQVVDIPQSITVVTRDVMNDLGEVDLSKVLTYVGGVPLFSGELYQLRGSNALSTYPVVDGLISRTVFMDNLFIDSMEIIRGPAALLYPSAQLTGIINKTTKRPQAKRMTSLQASVTDFGQWRFVGDTTGPIGKLGDGQVNYRVVGGLQGGDAYFTNTKEDRTMFHPSLQWDNEKTSVMIAFDYQKITRPSNPTGIMQPNGIIFTGNGRENSLFLPPGASETHEHNGFRGVVVHRLSHNWETKLGLDWNQLHRTGSIVLPTGGVNWNNRTISFFNRRNDIQLDNASVSLDTNGYHQLGEMKFQSTFGFTITSQKAIQKLWTNTNFGGPGVTNNVRSIDNPDVDSLPVLPFDSYVAPANPGNRIRDMYGNFYFQENAEVIKDHLILVAGYAKFTDETSNIPNITSSAGTVVKVDSNLHRFGAVAQFFDKKLAFYAMTANTQLPRSPTAILQDGTSAPAPVGDGKEAGAKLSLLDNRLNATVSYFELNTDGLSVFGGVLPDGRSYNIPVGHTEAKGVDGEIGYSVSRQFDLICNFYTGKVKDQAGNPVDNSYRNTVGIIAKYSFRDGALKGLEVGAGGYRTGGRVTATGALTYVGKPAFIENKAEPIVKLFANYAVNSHLSLKLQVDNVLDEVVPLAINSAVLMETNLPRTFTLRADYRF